MHVESFLRKYSKVLPIRRKVNLTIAFMKVQTTSACKRDLNYTHGDAHKFHSMKDLLRRHYVDSKEIVMVITWIVCTCM